VGVGNPQPGKWTEHLVVNLADQVLIDLTLDQADRPQHGIVLPMPVVAPVGLNTVAMTLRGRAVRRKWSSTSIMIADAAMQQSGR
jgi:hypothetical protein